MSAGILSQLRKRRTPEVRSSSGVGEPGRTPLLSIQNLYRDFGGLTAVDGVSFTVREGTITGLIGPNGAGKSTVLNLIAGSIAPSRGAILIDGEDATHAPAHERARRGIIRTFQISTGFPRLTVMENLLVAVPNMVGESFVGALRGKRYWKAQEMASVDRARDLLRTFELTPKESEYVGNLSGGQKRLVEIMRALMAQPRLLLLDEPMAGVHPRLAQRIADHLEELRDQGLTMMLIEHELGLIERLCDPIIVMAQGKVISEGTMSAVRSQSDVVNAYFVG